ncbi:MAG: helix-hairpin-helix domain-containing protein [Bacillus sp. (in: firmicutes)]
MKLKQSRWLYIAGAAIVVIVGFMAVMLFQGQKNEETALIADFAVEQSEIASNDAQQENVEEEIIMKVDVKGAVTRPGLYIANEGDRVLDVIEQAGSFTQEANQNGINLAQRVEDQMVIYVPAIGEEGQNVHTAISTTDSTISADGGAGGKININKATASELETITGIGPSKAAAIMQYRSENGSFKNIDELKNISGIGEKTFEKLKDEVTI